MIIPQVDSGVVSALSVASTPMNRVREETGLAHYDGGAFAAGIANTIFP